jgi:hypothetical protein
MQYIPDRLSYQIMNNLKAGKSNFPWLYQTTTLRALVIAVSFYWAEHIITFAVAAG